MSEWISVDDRLPEVTQTDNLTSSDDLLICGISHLTGQNITTIGWLNSDGNWQMIIHYLADDLDVTHWQPLPKPPTNG